MPVCVNRRCSAELPEGAVYCPLCGKKQEREPRKALKRPNGAGTVYKLSGRRRRPWVAAKNKVIFSKSAGLEALSKLAGVNPNDRYNMTFEQIFTEWSAEHFKTIGPHGIPSYKDAFRILGPLHNKKFRSRSRTITKRT